MKKCPETFLSQYQKIIIIKTFSNNDALVKFFSLLKLSLKKSTTPDAVEDSPILEDPQQLVVCGDIMEVGSFLVGEEEVRLPYGVQHRWVQVKGGIWVFTVRQPRVIPLLPQEDVHSVILRRWQAALHILQRSDSGYENACWWRNVNHWYQFLILHNLLFDKVNTGNFVFIF